MKLYLLERENTDWDQANGFVVASTSPSRARKLAAKGHGDEGANAWVDISLSTCKQIARETNLPEGIVICDFQAG